MSMHLINPGLKAAVRSAARPGPSSAADILGPAYKLDHDARAGYWAPGTGSEVASAVNRGLHGSGADLITGAASTRPDAETTGGHENWDFKNSTASRIFQASAGHFYEVGDAFSLIMVMQLDATVPSAARSYGGTYQASTATTGAFIWSATQFACRLPSAGSYVTLIAPGQPTTRSVVRATHTGNVDLQGELWINGVKVASSVVGTQNYYGDGVAFGADPTGIQSGDFDMNRGTVVANGSASQLSDYDQHLMDLYEIP